MFRKVFIDEPYIYKFTKKMPTFAVSYKRTMAYILGIESSCDDTSAAVLHNTLLLSNVIASQEVHKKYGGVVPELASRAHQQNIVPVVSQALEIAGIGAGDIDAIAFTRGPGLLGSLLVGTSFAKGLSLALEVPLIEVNHLTGHVLSHFIDTGSKKPAFPFLCLLVFGEQNKYISPHLRERGVVVNICSTEKGFPYTEMVDTRRQQTFKNQRNGYRRTARYVFDLLVEFCFYELLVQAKLYKFILVWKDSIKAA
jgi:hypothetical protein